MQTRTLRLKSIQTKMVSKRQALAQLILRIAIAITMLSAVADRFGLWGSLSSWGNWSAFQAYARKLTFFLPEALSNVSGYVVTFLEMLFSLLLLIGYKTRWTACGTSLLMFLFALSMSIGIAPNAPLNYSVWVGSAAALLLSTIENYKWSVDNLLLYRD